MIGNMITRIRTEKGMSKTELARLANINIGHITHIEKGERKPSPKTLKLICKALGIPSQQLMYTLGNSLNDDQIDYNFVKYVSYNKILAVDNVNNFIDCPTECPTASIALKVNDDSMEPSIKKDSYVYIEFNAPLNNKDLGLFQINDNIIIRKFAMKRGKIHLTAANSKYPEIVIDSNDDFCAIGKIVGNF